MRVFFKIKINLITFSFGSQRNQEVVREGKYFFAFFFSGSLLNFLVDYSIKSDTTGANNTPIQSKQLGWCEEILKVPQNTNLLEACLEREVI